MKYLRKIINWLSSLKVAIVLLILIALGSALGTALPQGEKAESYLKNYEVTRFLGVINGDLLLQLQLDHVYSSFWFLFLLTWLSFSLIICSWKRQWPSLKKAIDWIDYKEPKQIQKLAISQSFRIQKNDNGINPLANYLENNGWQVKIKSSRLAARKGLIGRVGPPLVHFGLILLIIGATYGVLKGQRLEKFLAPERSLNLLSPNGISKVSVKLTDFKIDRDPTGKPEQFRSKLELHNNNINKSIYEEISVNHPLRFQGITLYQADWSLAAITIQINNSPKIQFPLNKIDELGDQVWGIVLPQMPDSDLKPLLLTLSSEQGPVRFFSEEGNPAGIGRPNGNPILIGTSKISIIDVIPSSGILLKYDPGVPIVYLGFAISLIGSVFSIISTKQLWIIQEEESRLMHIGGLSNRNLSGFANQFNSIIKAAYD
ncbi:MULTISPECIES: cytochrome c biogenesis protein ResB [Prochlorococcus]|uniref:Cytochrome c biogenesis protein CcsB n=1 Tax=Prochlorococcus marinus (strain SARG / CCMP1375 / SS120) TaxID=167539 RepID=CCS1_PROMA|nr:MULTISPECIES: cytochrome c biogenesis protein ResB [Prochlorococcus]Q7VA54.1 RecName: Full=Cytochrome c biogenesis protein CcsB [Prochlorococcus marinus subsp. marinus str. CCMP1375]AAQ00657.1 ResB-like protein required for cytochrome c biosynthesis [Prochlorococcus marinus subsp. marinus str. CCMP1375]KGG10848.1 Cytochrome c-type bioproteinsis protein Ccs1/ResB [Prochlorococcus marinus str. LG]KGG34712.1 Cytochrome c-type bioproteinsis protein Ccs1/ResB [Prochlorococcus sp. SS52]